jgi:ribose-phosphate pyrophosphokinase
MRARVWRFAEDRAPAERLAVALGAPTGVIQVHRFPDGESRVTACSDCDTAIVYRSLDRPNERIIEVLLAADALRRSGARRVVLVAPYLGYMRQDAVFAPGEALSQHVAGNLLATAFDRVVSVDPHLHRTARLRGAVPAKRADVVSAAPAIADYLRGDPAIGHAVIIGPDRESAAWTQGLADLLHRPWTTFEKSRCSDHLVRLVPPPPALVAGKPCVLIDDICSGGATMRAALLALAQLGAGRRSVVVTHALFTDVARWALICTGAAEIASCDSVAHATNRIALAGVLARALCDEVSP